ncbi:hydantoinase/oxoprolinase family protein [Agrobacterium fabrum]|uniref:hydantoinase/oxoprolinase family protein n=1 Tax=Agrobacterium fabrum TaxID=1176649 RepID=UPI0015717B3F|nr:hydantoinase/oxoprolinase family protein [Agrobacterium fabrum]WCK80086.1 hydantoinase/oxoprolinase family protein [Agrobacterium fabrum]
MLRIGVDIGGTFTDFCGWAEGRGSSPVTLKVPSTPPDFDQGFRNGFERLLKAIEPAAGEAAYVFHGTTVSTNAIIERTGSKVALFTTEGYRDIMELQRLGVRNPLNLFETRVEPLVHRGMVFEVEERLLGKGVVRRPLDAVSLRNRVRAAKAAGAESYAVALLHSYANPDHERQVRDIIVEEVGIDADVTLSSEIWPRPGEYERALLAVLNAFVRRRMRDYISEIENYVAERLPGSQLFVTRSNGGAMAAREAMELPVHTLLSGPASGVTAVQHLGRLLGEKHILTMDMGGTSTDVSLVRDGETLTTGSAEVGDFPVVMPVTGVEAIGAGGGSIIYMDGKILRVGPQSAGARPGPACFSRGGLQPTLTDAYLLSGYLPDALLGGAMPLDRAAAERALAPIAEALGTDVASAAEMAVRVGTSNMEAGVLPFVARYGVDPEELTLVVYGGGGAIHGPIFASEMGMRRILVPDVPSVFCAYGGLVSEVRHDVTATVQGEDMDSAAVAKIFRNLHAEAESWLALQVDVALLRSLAYEYWAEMRYKGQSFEVDVSVEPSAVERGDITAMFSAFHSAHERLYSHANPSSPAEFVHLRVRVRGTLPTPPALETPSTRDALVPISRRDIRFGGTSYPDSPIYDRDVIGNGSVVVGPCVVEQRDATIFVPPGYTLSGGTHDNLLMTKG